MPLSTLIVTVSPRSLAVDVSDRAAGERSVRPMVEVVAALCGAA
jgi:hypothetical protein